MNKYNFTEYFQKLKDTVDSLDTDIMENFVDRLLECRERDGFIYIFGNGGSAANASHIAGDFIKGISYGLEKPFRAMSLCDNVSGLTAISNDLGYDEIFLEQLRLYLKPNDMVIGISGSGNSVNVLKAMEFAKNLKAETIGLVGYKGGKLKELVDLCVLVPINDMEITEDIHVSIFHAIKQEIIKKLKGDDVSYGTTYDKRVNQ
jgi:D-sedoheptulose 7-phosphate isomerase